MLLHPSHCNVSGATLDVVRLVFCVLFTEISKACEALECTLVGLEKGNLEAGTRAIFV